MQLSVQLEKQSEILRKLTIKVPADIVANRFERGLTEIQKTAKLKGFRPGQAPISVIKQYYGDDLRHRVYHSLIDESFREAVREHQLRAVGSPKIDTPDHKTGEGEHDHAIAEDRDFTYTATIEVLPEIQVKNYTKIALTREPASVADGDVEKVIEGLLDQHAQMIPASGGLVGADGKPSSRPVRTKDFVEMTFDGGIVTPAGVEAKEGMKGSRTLEIGSDSLIPGFEDQLIGMRAGETKTFRLPFPADFYEKELAGKESEFTVTIHEVKEKKLPTLDEEFAKQLGYEGVADFRAKARGYLEKERQETSDRKLRSDLLGVLIEKNPFDVPQALIEAETRAIAQDWAQNLKRQGLQDDMIQQAIGQELENLRKRAERQVRSSLLIEAVGKNEKIEVTDADFMAEVKSAAVSMKTEESKLLEFYDKEPARKDEMLYRIRQERAMKFLVDSAKIKG